MLRVRPLLDDEVVRAYDVHCHAPSGRSTTVERPDDLEIVLPRRGLFVRHLDDRQVLADANHALFFKSRQAYRVSHPLPGGDACTVLVLRGDRMRTRFGVDEEVLPDRICTTPAIDLLHRGLVMLEPGGEAAAEIALEIVRRVFVARRTTALEGSSRRRASRSTHPAVVDHVCTELARSPGTGLGLHRLARGAGLSPFHLARVFRARTGITVHRYHERLRLRRALDRLLAGTCEDLSALALETGFAHHSHFTDRFRREFGLVPSAARSLRTGRDFLAAARGLPAPDRPG